MVLRIAGSYELWIYASKLISLIHISNYTIGLCVYTNSTFADSRGISFIATPSVIQDVLKAAAFTGKLRSPDTINVSHKYIRKSVPGNKRFEMLAKVLMKRGESLHSYQPVLAVQDPLLSRMTKEDQTLLLRIAIERLPKASQELFLSQFAEDDKDPYIDRMDKNAFNSQFGRSREFFSAALPETAVSDDWSCEERS